jgi:hypothetical protein
MAVFTKIGSQVSPFPVPIFGVNKEFLSKEVPVVLCLFLFIGGEVLEAESVFGEFLDRTGLTGLLNRSDQFPLPV